jgi:hypothetical protein
MVNKYLNSYLIVGGGGPFQKRQILEPCVIEKVAATLWPQALILKLCAAHPCLPGTPSREGPEREKEGGNGSGSCGQKKIRYLCEYILVIYYFLIK